MIKAYFASFSKSNSLTAKIRDTEQQLVIRQREVGIRTDALIKKIHREMTAPSTLLMTVGIGFILGELTRRRTSINHPVAGKQRTNGVSPLRTSLNLITSAHTLYMALPIAWKTRIFNPSAKQGRQAPERQAQPITSTSCAAKDRGSSKRQR